MQLTRKRAYECEFAIESRCRCRCGGKFHGAKRTRHPESLAPTDPHYVPKPVDSGLRAIAKLTQVHARIKGHKRFIAHLECGHQIVLPGSKLGVNRSRAHCDKCAPNQVMLQRQRRAEAMDKTLCEFFEAQEKRERKIYTVSKFPTGFFHVVERDDPNFAIGPGSTKERPIKELAAMMNRITK